MRGMTFRRLWILCFILCGGIAAEASAHDHRAQHIDHDSCLCVDEKNIDVSAVLLFHAQCSLAERKRMDLDADGTISAKEEQAYLQRLMPRLADGLEVRVDGHRREVVLLYDPRIDFLGSRKVQRSALEMHLAWFARLPEGHNRPEHIAVVNRLWPRTPMVGDWRFAPNDAIRLERVAKIGASVDPRTIQVRCQPLFSRTVPPQSIVKETAIRSVAASEREGRKVATLRAPWLLIPLAAMILVAAGVGCVYYRRCRLPVE